MALSSLKVAVRLTAINGITPVLNKIARDVVGLDKKVNILGMRWGRLKIAAAGAVAVMGGIAMLKAVSVMARYGDEIRQVETNLRMMGVSARDVQRTMSAAFRVSQTVPGISYGAAGNLGTTLTSIFGPIGAGPGEARRALPGTAQAESILNYFGSGGESNLKMLLKAVEASGGATKTVNGQRVFSVSRYQDTLTRAIQAIVYSRGILTPAQLLQSTKLSLPGAVQMQVNPLAMWAAMGELTQVLGPTAGRGVGMAYQQLLGGKMPRPMALLMQAAGMIKPGSLQYMGGGTELLKYGGLKGTKVLEKEGILAWVYKILQPTLAAHGHKSTNSQMEAIEQMFSSRPEMRFIATLITNKPQIERTIQAMKNMPKLLGLLADVMNTVKGQTNDLTAAMQSLMQVLGGPAAQLAIPFLQGLTKNIKSISLYMHNNPAVAHDLVGVLAGLGGALVTLGGAAVLGALVSMVGPGGLIVALATGLTLLSRALNGMPSWIIDAMTGAAVGAAVGSVIPGVGTGVGAIAGFVGGALWNHPPKGFSAGKTLGQLTHAAAQAYGLPENFIRALIGAESGGNANAVSSAGAVGLMQLMPKTAGALGVTNAFNPAQNIFGGTRYFEMMLSYWRGNYKAAVAAYTGASSSSIRDYLRTGNLGALPADARRDIMLTSPYMPGYRSPVVPPPAPKTTGDDPVHKVHVVNGKDIAHGVTTHIRRGVDSNPSGPSGFNSRMGFSPPGLAYGPSGP